MKVNSVNQCGWPRPPRIKRRLANPHDLAQNTHWIVRRLSLDKRELYFISFAKKALAFFKISFSMRSSLFSLRKRFSSSRSSSASAFP
jgi:hypothetical protein